MKIWKSTTLIFIMNSLSNTLNLKGLSLLVAGLFFFSCRQENHDLKLPGEAELPSNTIYSDTFSVDLSSVLVLDDYVTSNPYRNGASYIMTGGYQDALLGNTKVNAFSQLQLSQEYVDLSDIIIDSSYLELDYNYAYGDTNQTQTLEVYQLTSAIDASVSYFANSTEPTYSGLLGSASFKARPVTSTNIRIPISDNTFLTSIINGPKNNASFVNDVKGLAFIPVDNNGAIIRINLSSSLSRLFIYYKQSNVSKVYELNFTGKRYFTVHQDRSATGLSSLVNGYDAINSALTSNNSYIQSGTGLRTKVTFPYLDKFIAEKGNIYIHKAELVFPLSSVSGPDSTYLVKAGSDGHVTFTNSYVNTVQNDASAVNGYVFTQYATRTDNAYTFQLRAYLQSLVYNEISNHGLLLTPTKNNVEFTSGVFNNQDAVSGQVKLKIYYTSNK